MHQAAFADTEELKKHVADPEAWMQNRRKTVIGFSDQIPVWVKIGRGKQVYAEPELKRRQSSADLKKMEKERMKKYAKEKEGAIEDEKKQEAAGDAGDREDEEMLPIQNGGSAAAAGADEDDEDVADMPALMDSSDEEFEDVKADEDSDEEDEDGKEEKDEDAGGKKAEDDEEEKAEDAEGKKAEDKKKSLKAGWYGMG